MLHQFLVNTYKINNKDIEEKMIKILWALNEVDEKKKKALKFSIEELGYNYQENINKYLTLHQIKVPKCIEYKVAKMSRKSRGRKTPKATKILEIIHSDISGPYSSSVNNKKKKILYYIHG